jgi:hypothetical protein
MPHALPVERAATAEILRLDTTRLDLSAPAVRAAALETLESGGLVLLLGSRFALTTAERDLIANTRHIVRGIDDADIRDGKPTIIYEPWRGRIKRRRYAHARGRFARTDIAPAVRRPLESMMARFSTWATDLIAELFPSYPAALTQDRVTYRPHERNATQALHVDSSYGYPTEGRGMFRLFTNVDPSGRPRVWQVGEPFESFARRFVPGIRLREPGPIESLLSRIRIRRGRRTLYDDVIAELRLLGKRDREYQRTAPREIVTFPSGSSWLAITDLVPHGAVSGRHSLDQTFFLPATGMVDPHRSSLYILERLIGRQLA